VRAQGPASVRMGLWTVPKDAGSDERVRHQAGVLQPIEETLLLICCRCSTLRSPAQFQIAFGVDDAAAIVAPQPN
jgi:hypothetical protein